MFMNFSSLDLYLNHRTGVLLIWKSFSILAFWIQRSALRISDRRPCSYFTVTATSSQIDLRWLPRRRSFPVLLRDGGGREGGKDDFWGRLRRLTELWAAVKMEPLINTIDQQKNKGECDLHTGRMINALTDFFSSLLWNLISRVFKVRQREFRLMWIDCSSLRQEYKAFY